MLATQGKSFARHKNALYGILYSTKVVHQRDMSKNPQLKYLLLFKHSI